MTVTIRPSNAYATPPPAYSTIPMDGRQLAQQCNIAPSPTRRHRNSLSQTAFSSAGMRVNSLQPVGPNPIAAHHLHHHPCKGGKLPAKVKAKSSSMISYRTGGSGNGAGGSDPTDGCCLLKTLISNFLNFAMRSRRKAENLQQHTKQGGGCGIGGVGAGGMGMALSNLQQHQQPHSQHSTAVTGGATGQPVTASNETCSALSSPSRRGNGAEVNSTSLESKGGAGGGARHQLTTQQSVEPRCVADSLDDQMIDMMCDVPSGLDRNEWMATQTLSLFDHVNALCAIVSDVCTPVSCSVMSYPGTSKASWSDERGKRHHYSAGRYIDCVMSFCDASRLNPALFPTKHGAVFGADFEPTCRRMVRLLWHCLGHLFVKHWSYVTSLELRSQFALVLAHMNRLVRLFNLMESKETGQLANTLQVIRPTGTVKSSSAASRYVKKRAGSESSSSTDVSIREATDISLALSGPTEHATRDGTMGDEAVETIARSIAANIGPRTGRSSAHHSGGGGSYLPSMKSGSWGGHAPALAVSCKGYAQTC